MQHYQAKYLPIFPILVGLMLTLNFWFPNTAYAASVTNPLDFATVPLANSPTIKIQPNLLFVLDDSGSMGFNYLPDWADDLICKNITAGSFNLACVNQPPFRSSDFNAIYYNPAIVYAPAVSGSGGKVNTSGDSKGSQTTWTSVKNDAYNIQSTASTNLVSGYTDVEWCTDTNYTDCLRNDNYILPGTVNGKSYITSRTGVKATGTGTVATGSLVAPTTASRSYGPHYYNITPGEYCDSAKLTNCQLTQTAAFNFPAKVRWCKSTTGPVSAEANAIALVPATGSCQSTRVSPYTAARYPGKFFSPAVAANPGQPYIAPTTGVAPANGSFVVSGVAKNQTITVSKCGTVSIINSFKSSNSSTASTRLNSLQTTLNGTIGTQNGYKTTCSAVGSPTSSLSCVVSAPVGVSACSSFVFDNYLSITANTGPSGGVNGTAGQPYIAPTPAQDGNYPGSFSRVDIVAGNTYPKAVTRTDCAGATGAAGCSYAEEMTNFANWWTYYQTRMQTMKSAASLAFKEIGEDFRVGFMTIHPTAGDSVNFDTFNSTQKTAWYNKFFSIPPGSATPLRSALAKAGRIYANQETIGGKFTDPIEYACQQNFTLLTTDGLWNTDVESDVKKIDGTQVGNQDASPIKPPYYEGATASSNSLADVAKYYHDTDLRTAGNCAGALNLTGDGVCQDPAPSTANQRQNMVTLTLGLGVDGELSYSTDYKNANTGDYASIKAGTLNWPVPLNNSTSAVDDLWHAAVNGEGTYFSAKSPAELSSQLKEALATIKVKVGAGAAAATSTLNPVAGDNYAYVASYTSGYWAGNLEKREIFTTGTNAGGVDTTALKCVEDVPNVSSCLVSASTSVVGSDCVTTGVTNPLACPSPGNLVGTNCVVPLASACVGQLKSQSYTSRNIYMRSGTSLTLFNYSNIAAVGLDTTFNSPFLSANLTQWPSLASTRTAAEMNANVAGTNLVNYLRGDMTYDGGTSVAANKLYRKRYAILGDAVNSKPAFIGKPTFSYTDPGYDAFKNGPASSRDKIVYMGANDGMLHAFDADSLIERWAYVPTMVIANMWKLADTAYENKHSFYVDGDPVISDICVSSCDNAGAVWKTILVAGLNSGGRGYYALDITNPNTPLLLWEFSASNDANLGYTYGNPVITKRPSDGKWVVLLTSGYNNISDNDAFYGLTSTKFKPFSAPASAQYTGGNGKGYLYVLDANSGLQLNSPISTGAGTSTNPSGLAKIKAFSEDAEKNNTSTYVYGGDLHGNVWRFNLLDNTVTKFASLQASGTQPVTTPPELGVVNNNRVVFIGTGKYLEVSDLTDTSQQTLYAIKDDNSGGTLTNPRSSLVQQTIIASGVDGRTSNSSNTVNFSTGLGWYIDLPESGERQNVASQLVLGTLLVPTTVPTSSACQPAGYGWFNYFDYKTGTAVTLKNPGAIVSARTNSPTVGFNVVYVDGKPKVSIVTADDPTPKLLPNVPFPGSPIGFQKKRSIWRELIN